MIDLGSGLRLPDSVVTERLAFLAKSGAGKTYAAGVLAEELLQRNQQIVVLDPVAKWWGLRLRADGRTKAFTIPVFGGKHGDLPLSPTSGKVCAHAVVERNISAVFDLILFESEADKRRFVADFCKELFRLKSQEDTPRPLHVFLEEAEEFIPQTWDSADAQMIGAVKRLFKLGRNFGIGGSLISQRSAGVNKQALSQVEYMLALRTKAKTDIKAVSEWIEYAAGDDVAKEVVKSISTLDVGEAWLVGGNSYPKRGTVRVKNTLDTSGTPKGVARKIETPKLSEKDLQQLRDAIGEAVVEAEANDVRKLRARIAELEKVVQSGTKATKDAPAAKPVTPVPSKLIQRIEKAIAQAEKLQTQNEMWRAGIDKTSTSLVTSFDGLGALIAEATAALKAASGGTVATGNGKSPATPQFRRETHPAPPRVDFEGSNSKGPQSILDALATFHPKPLSRTQLSTMTGYTAATMQKYLGGLRAAHLVDGWKTIELTDTGRAQAGSPKRPRSTAEMTSFWCHKLGAGPGAILQHLVDIYPQTADRDELLEATKYTAATLRKYLGRLRSLALINKHGSTVKAGSELFPDGR